MRWWVMAVVLMAGCGDFGDECAAPNCDDGDPCTRDEIVPNPAGGCPICANDAIDGCVNGCGNGVVDDGETCDGDCPTTCTDADACTFDVLSGAGTCQAVCDHPPVTQAQDGDGCCPPGADATVDSDCMAICGNAVVEPGERCDGDCPTDCDDGIGCTRDTLVDPLTCQARCTSVAITTTANGDGCCLPGDNATTDGDCAPACGNGVVEPGEDCDEPNVSDSGCDMFGSPCHWYPPAIHLMAESPVSATPGTSVAIALRVYGDHFDGDVALSAMVPATWTIAFDRDVVQMRYPTDLASVTATVTVPSGAVDEFVDFHAASTAQTGTFDARTTVHVP